MFIFDACACGMTEGDCGGGVVVCCTDDSIFRIVCTTNNNASGIGHCGQADLILFWTFSLNVVMVTRTNSMRFSYHFCGIGSWMPDKFRLYRLFEAWLNMFIINEQKIFMSDSGNVAFSLLACSLIMNVVAFWMWSLCRKAIKPICSVML